MVIGTLERGGAEHQMVGLAEHLALRGNEVEVVALSGAGPLAGRLDSAGIGVITFPLPGAFRQIPKVRGAFRLGATVISLARHWHKARPQVVHAWLPEAQIVALPLARILGIPVRVLSLRSLRSGVRSSASLDVLFRFALRASTSVTANSAAVAGDPEWRLNRDRVDVITNAVTLPDNTADASKQPPVGIVLANLIAYKGHLDLLEALHMCTTKPRLMFVGDGPERARIEEALRQRGLQDQVELHGSLAQPTDALLASQFAVSASHTEGLPNAILEALATGLPVIATDAGGSRELIESGVNGLLVSVGEPQELAKAIDALVSDPLLRETMGGRARCLAARHDWPSVVDQYLDLYVRDLELE